MIKLELHGAVVGHFRTVNEAESMKEKRFPKAKIVHVKQRSNLHTLSERPLAMKAVRK